MSIHNIFFSSSGTLISLFLVAFFWVCIRSLNWKHVYSSLFNSINHVCFSSVQMHSIQAIKTHCDVYIKYVGVLWLLIFFLLFSVCHSYFFIFGRDSFIFFLCPKCSNKLKYISIFRLNDPYAVTMGSAVVSFSSLPLVTGCDNERRLRPTMTTTMMKPTERKKI